MNSSSCSSVISSIAACLTIFGDSSSLLTDMILPSTLILTGAPLVKKRSDAPLSTIN